MPDFDEKGTPDNYTGKYEQRGSEFYGHGNQHSKSKGMPMIEAAGGAIGMIAGMMGKGKKKEDTPADYKSPIKNKKDEAVAQGLVEGATLAGAGGAGATTNKPMAKKEFKKNKRDVKHSLARSSRKI